MKSQFLKSKDNKKLLITLLGFILLSIVYIFLVYWINKNIDIFLCTDLFSEIILSNLMADTKSFFLDNWYYTTEIRVINMQLVYVPLFWIFSDWSTVLSVGIAIWFIILIASFYFLYRRLDLDICYFPYFAICLICPLSYEYLYFSEAGNYYMPFICISFWMCGLLFSVFKTDMSSKVKKINYILALLLGFVSSLGGIRMILCLYLPMLMASAILLFTEEKENILELRIKNTPAFQFFILNICNIIVSGIGYCINFKILPKYYSFNNFDYLRWIWFSLEELENTFNGWLEYFGYITGENLLGHRALRHNIVCAILIVIVITAVVYAIKKGNMKYKCLTIIFCMAVLTSSALFVFTEMGITTRYLFPFAFLFVPILACLFHEIRTKIRYPILIVSELLLLLICFCINDYAKWGPRISIADNRAAVEYLLANDLTEGYATGQQLTFFSNGEIEVWYVVKDTEEITEGFTVKPWQQLMSHTQEIPGGGDKTFFAIDRDEYNADGFYSQHFDMEDLIYENDSYLIFGYENMERLENILLY